MRSGCHSTSKGKERQESRKHSRKMNRLVRGLFGQESSEVEAASHLGELPSLSSKEQDFNILVIDHTAAGTRNWASFFVEAATGNNDDANDKVEVQVDGKTRWLRVFQARWEDISVTSYGSIRNGTSQVSALCELVVERRGGRSGGSTILGSTVTFRVDFVLVRNQVVGALPEQDFRTQLFALMHANVPSVNSLPSIYQFIERVVPFAELQRIRSEVGASDFPVIEQTYYPSHKEMIVSPSFPLVVKTGHAHAGFGKMKLVHHHDFADLRGVIAMTKFGCTAEPFLDGEYELRVQKIGEHIRVMKRIGVSGSWKTNTGAAILEDVEVTDQYRMWAERCGQMFGGLEILAVDALHTTDGKEYILEVNDTAIGLGPSHHDEDSLRIAALVLAKVRNLRPQNGPVEQSASNFSKSETSL